LQLNYGRGNCTWLYCAYSHRYFQIFVCLFSREYFNILGVVSFLVCLLSLAMWWIKIQWNQILIKTEFLSWPNETCLNPTSLGLCVHSGQVFVWISKDFLRWSYVNVRFIKNSVLIRIWFHCIFIHHIANDNKHTRKLTTPNMLKFARSLIFCVVF
jgi:hypothetical protein